MPESLRNHLGATSDRPNAFLETLSQEELWAKQQEDQLADAEKRIVDRAEQALRQNGHFLAFEAQQEMLDAGNDAEMTTDKKAGGKQKPKKEGGCTIY